MTRSRCPAGLEAAGRRLWREITTSYHLSPAERLTLERACKTADLLVRVDAELATARIMQEGSMGQPRSHPLIASRVELDELLDQLLRALALPMPGEDEGKRRTPAAQAAARRWGSA